MPSFSKPGPLAALMLLAFSARVQAASFDPSYLGIGALHDALESRQLSCETLVRHYLDRIGRFDRQGPTLNALLRLNENALATAHSMDRAGPTLRRGPLYCIPFLAKDNMDVKGMATAGGSVMLADNVVESNAFVVQKLLDAGAILLGKTNMSEMATSYGRLGYSSLGGLTLNPYNPARDASGSSSGSAAAVAADFAVFALGTDTSGSSRAPASVTGLVGIRPSTGRVSRTGIIPAALSFDTPGVLARSVADAAAILAVIAGPDDADAATEGQAPVPDYPHELGTRDLQGLRLGVLKAFRGGNAEVDAIEERTLRLLAERGARLVPVTLPGEFLSIWERVLSPVSEAEFRPQFERYLRQSPSASAKTLAQFLARSGAPEVQASAHPPNPKLLAALSRADEMQLTESPQYLRLLTMRVPALRDALRQRMDQSQVSALIFATMACPATPRFDRQDASYQCSAADPYAASYIASVTGFAELTLPMGVVSAHVPVGISLLGRPFEEVALLKAANAVTAALPALPRPQFPSGR